MSWKILIDKSVDPDGRCIAEKDYDKIVFSQAFRRMSRKTQVHPLAVNDHVHNRMIHSLEVANVGRSIVYNIQSRNGLDKQLAAKYVMAAGIGHDFGNPPFGHLGENAISKWVIKNSEKIEACGISKGVIDTYKSYDGNPQNFHLFASAEYFNKKPLSDATLASMVKYPKESHPGAGKSGYYSFDSERFDRVFTNLRLVKNGNYFRHPLSYLMEAADDICYTIMDIDDAMEMGIIETTDYEFKEDVNRLLGKYFTWQHKEQFRSERGAIIQRATKQVAEVFDAYYSDIMSGNIDIGVDLIKLAEGHRKRTLLAIASLKKWSQREIYKHRRKVKLEVASYSIIPLILDNWLTSYQDFHGSKFIIKETTPQTKRTYELFEMYAKNLLPKRGDAALIQAIDYVSGMTDRFAQSTAKVLLGVYE